MIRRFATGLVTLSLLATGCASIDQGGGSRLELISKRGQLHCGVSGKIPGFSFLLGNGRYEGLDVDICRAMAAAVVALN